MRWVLMILAAAIAAFVGFSFWISRPVVEGSYLQTTTDIAPREIALSFARTPSMLVLVTGSSESGIEGIDLTSIYGEASSDVITLYQQVGYEVLAELESETIEVFWENLDVVHDYARPFIAVGTNYSEHADEVYLDDPPFLFPKLSVPTAWNADVDYTERLDYEAELCLVPLEDITSPDSNVDFGMVLCNDFTDRWTLLAEIELDSPMGTTGFAAAKGRESFLPTGALLVIPRDQDMIESITLELFVNDRQRQRFDSGTMILKPRAIIRETFLHMETAYYEGDVEHRLIDESIPEGSLILTGTAAGVMFKPANVWNQAFYLDAGDLVITRANWLGQLENRIRPTSME